MVAFVFVVLRTFRKSNISTKAGAYILENTPPPWGGRISAMSFVGKKYEKAKRKRKKI
jgi:hypothetical protein